MIIDGKKIAEEVLRTLEAECKRYKGVTLGIVMEGGNAATNSFVKIKSRIAQRLGIEVRRFSPAQWDEALRCDGVVIQLPIANGDELIKKLPPEKDVDALGPSPKVRPPVAEAISEILVRHNVAAAGKRAAVVGSGRLVGAPAAELLRDTGAKVSVVTTTHGTLEELLDAEIVVLGAGEPGLVTPEMLMPGAIIIDAGTSEQGGKLAGDADPRCAEVASLFTPVPGGVGPIAVAMLFKNLLTLKRMQ